MIFSKLTYLRVEFIEYQYNILNCWYDAELQVALSHQRGSFKIAFRGFVDKADGACRTCDAADETVVIWSETIVSPFSLLFAGNQMSSTKSLS